MSAKLKIYSVIGIGFVVAEELSRTNENIFTKYPAVMTMVQNNDKKIIPVFRDLVPGFFKNYDSLIKKFPVKRRLVSMEDEPAPMITGWYDQYLKDLTKRMTGLETAGADALSRLPKNPDGSPLIQ